MGNIRRNLFRALYGILLLNSAGVGEVWAVALPYQTGYLNSAATVAYYGPTADPVNATASAQRVREYGFDHHAGGETSP